MATYGALLISVLVHQLLDAVIARVQTFALAGRQRARGPVTDVAEAIHGHWREPGHI